MATTRANCWPRGSRSCVSRLGDSPRVGAKRGQSSEPICSADPDALNRIAGDPTLKLGELPPWNWRTLPVKMAA